MLSDKEENQLGEEMHKNECDWSGGQRCSEENVEKLCQEGHEGYGYKGGNGTGTVKCSGEILLGVRHVLARMPGNTVCVLGSRTLNEYRYMMMMIFHL